VISNPVYAGPIWYADDANGSDLNSGSQTCPFKTISFAIGASSNGETVYVEPGTYDEQVDVNKAITLQGAAPGFAPFTVIQKSSPAVNPNIVTVSSSDVTIKNLTVGGGPGVSTTRGVYINGAYINIALQDVIASQHLYGVVADASADLTNLSLSNVQLSVNGNGLHIEAGAKVNGLTVTGGSMDSNLFGLSAAANNAADNSNDLVDVNITGTSFQNNAAFGLLFNKGQAVTLDGITVTGNGTAGLTTAGVYFTWRQGSYSGITVRNSTITGNGTNGDATLGGGIVVRPRAGASASAVQIENNFITGNGSAAGTAGIVVLRNDENTGSDPVVTITNNDLSGNAQFAISSTTTSPVDASCNWYGSAVLGDLPAFFSGAVQYFPYLLNGSDASANAGFQPEVGACGGFQLEGTMTYKNTANSPLNLISVQLLDASNNPVGTPVITDANGYYAFPALPAGATQLQVSTLKDWAGVNATDALAIELRTIGNIPANWTPALFLDKVGDVNASSLVNATDALLARRRSINQITSFAAGDFAFHTTTTGQNFTNVSAKVARLPLAGNGVLDIQALCYGDVNQSHSPETNKSINDLDGHMHSDAFIAVKPGREVEIPVRVSRDVEMGALTLHMMYDPSKVTITGFSTPLHAADHVVDGNWVRMAWSNVQPLFLQEGDAVATLTARVAADVTRDDLVFFLGSSTEVADGSAKVQDDVLLTVERLETLHPFSAQAHPVPFREQLGVRYTLSENATVGFTLISNTGAVVAQLGTRQHEGGAYELTFDAERFDLAPGIYHLRMDVRTANDSFINMIKVVHAK